MFSCTRMHFSKCAVNKVVVLSRSSTLFLFFLVAFRERGREKQRNNYFSSSPINPIHNLELILFS